MKKSFLAIFNIVFLPKINQKYKILFPQILYKKPTYEKAIKILNKTFSKTTLLIIDNIERMNEKSWEIIRTIQKLTILDNFIFLLPINKMVLNKNFEKKYSEWIIEKFINIPYYEFRQDFLGILKKYVINEEQRKFINEYLKTPINNKILTIRQLETNLEDLNIKNNGDISCLRKISLFWNNNLKLNEILIRKFIQFKNSIINLANLIKNENLKIEKYLYEWTVYNGNILTNFSKELIKIDSEIIEDFNKLKYKNIILMENIINIKEFEKYFTNFRNKFHNLENNKNLIIKNYQNIIVDIKSSLKNIITNLDEIIENDDYKEIILSLEKVDLNIYHSINQISNFNVFINNIMNKK